MSSPVNISQVKHLSPFRYPGGKTWFVPFALEWLHSLPRKPEILIEPFAGGAIIGLSALSNNTVDRLQIVELDAAVSATWHCIFHGDASELCAKIREFQMTEETVSEALLGSDVAFQTIIRNRVQRGGILAPGARRMKAGENGKGLASRWYPETIAARIEALQPYRDRVEVRQGDGLVAISENISNPGSAFFIDPPYTAGGKRAGSRLYAHNEIDHYQLFRLASEAVGPVLMTYDDCTEVRELASDFMVERIPMRTTHGKTLHELAIRKWEDLL